MRILTQPGVTATACLALSAVLCDISRPAWAGEAANQPSPAWDTFSDTWVAADGLGRSLPTTQEVGPVREGKTVGIFYFLWLNTRGPILDLSKMLTANPTNPAYGPLSAFHWWGEPLFGYYRSDDEFVIRKHAQMLSDAGVDVIVFDVTNGFTYDETYLAICRVFADMRRLGQKTPQIAFLAHSGSDRVVKGLYQRFYAKGLYADLWFQWQGKPLCMTPAAGLDEAALNFFTLRDSWAWTKGHQWFGSGRDKWPWLDNHPQTPGWHETPQKPEQVSVCVAQHPTSNIGRSFHRGQEPPPAGRDPGRGFCFAEQWERALEVNPEFVFVTGWNEWIAQRFVSRNGGQPFLGQPLTPGGTFFVDQYSQEFSRDIEPMKGGHGDNYYYQLAGNVRRYRGVRALPTVVSRPITVDDRFEDWTAVTPEFRDGIGDPVHRQHPGCGDAGIYLDDTGRNDIVAAKVSAGATNVYFYVRTRAPLTPPSTNWMMLFIDADQNPTNGWLGYDFVLNHRPAQPDFLTLERHQGRGHQWGTPLQVAYKVAGHEMELALPCAALGIAPLPAALDFKWADNILQTGEWSDFTLHGDAAPNDRFNYRAKLK
jgi:hypothetical protein